MRVHALNLLIALLVSGLITFGLVSADANTIKGTMAVGSFLFLGCTLGTALGCQVEQPRTAVNLKVLSGTFFVVGLAIQLVFSFGMFSQTSYVITDGVVFLTFILTANAVFGAKQ
ncbi:hypothetical protein [Massilia horti]|uniref:Uncharacterized protein n=1 Tax=Massilia horti TaxID=2562153 RepID=A0A4Y9SV49_9BURK|nr:hypothetical protein [Massilia horti]TFW28523.1 hypothetical protein E4O92_21190 [Massilia horti]